MANIILVLGTKAFASVAVGYTYRFKNSRVLCAYLEDGDPFSAVDIGVKKEQKTQYKISGVIPKKQEKTSTVHKHLLYDAQSKEEPSELAAEGGGDKDGLPSD